MLPLYVLMLLCGQLVQAQKYELGNVTKEELSEKSCPLDSMADAAVLFSKAVTYLEYRQDIGFQVITEADFKIKIYNAAGLEWAKKEVFFYDDGIKQEDVDFSNAVTYNLVNGKIEKTKLKKEGKFTEKYNDKYKIEKIAMPDARAGSIVEYKYTIRSPFIQYFPDWNFQMEIPVLHSEYTTEIPDYYTYDHSFRGGYIPTVTTNVENRRIHIITHSHREGLVTTGVDGTAETEYKEMQTTYAFDNLPALKGEKYVNTMDNYRESISHELSMVKSYDQPLKVYSHSWEDIAKTIYEQEDFGAELNKTGYYEKDADAILAGTASPEEKMAKVFAYVKNRMNWNGAEEYFCKKGVRKAYKDKTGNIAEINLMLTSMLRYAGLDANPVLVSTRDHAIALFPDISAFNYVVTAVTTDKGTVLLDASSKYALPGILPFRAINWAGRLIRKDGSIANLDLMPRDASLSMTNVMAKLDANGTVSGKVRLQLRDYEAYNFRESYSGTNKDAFLQHLEKKMDNIQTEHFEADYNDLSKPVTAGFDFSSNNCSENIGGKLYFNPLLFLTLSDSPFKAEQRNFPVDYIYPFEEKDMLSIELPEGYTVESLPEPLTIAMEDKLGSFTFNVAQAGGRLVVSAVFDINYAVVPADYYKTIKEFYQKVVDKEKEKIVLVKA